MLKSGIFGSIIFVESQQVVNMPIGQISLGDLTTDIILVVNSTTQIFIFQLNNRKPLP